MFSIFDCGTNDRLSQESYATAEEANHDYHMNHGHTYVGVVPPVKNAGVVMSARQKRNNSRYLLSIPFGGWAEMYCQRACGNTEADRYGDVMQIRVALDYIYRSRDVFVG